MLAMRADARNEEVSNDSTLSGFQSGLTKKEQCTHCFLNLICTESASSPETLTDPSPPAPSRNSGARIRTGTFWVTHLRLHPTANEVLCTFSQKD